MEGDIGESLIAHIKDHTGLELELCDHFKSSDEYVNVLLTERAGCSSEYHALQRMASSDRSRVKKVEINGLYRIAIYF